MTPHFVSKAAQVTGGMVCMCISDLFICYYLYAQVRDEEIEMRNNDKFKAP